MKKLKNNQTGQSLIEMLIAIFILIVALTATIVLIVTSINAGRDSINKLIATNLAREGAEIVRNIRDGNWIEPTGTVDWDAGLSIAEVGAQAVPAIVPFDLSSQNIFLESTTGFDDSKSQVYYSTSSNFYYQNYSGAVAAEALQFYRVIYLNDICQNDAGDEEIVSLGSTDDCSSFGSGSDYIKVGIRVVSEVRWSSANSGRKVQIEERLYNWQTL